MRPKRPPAADTAIPSAAAKSHFFRGYAQARATASAKLGRLHIAVPISDLWGFLAEIEVCLRACRIIKDKDLTLWLVFQ
jgi:hypothetical protein